MDSVLLHGEAEGYIQSLEKMSLRDIGSPRWFHQHEYIEKLNMQAILNASANQEEFIKDLFVSLGKIPTLVHSMILTEVWKHKVFPIICKLQDFNPKSTFLLHMVIHHEATIINLLETIMYHKESSEAAGDSVLDLVDYCHRKLTLLAGRSVSGEIPTEDRITHAQMSDTASVQDLQRQSDMLEFEISIKALSVLCYITDHIESLGLSVLSRMLCTHNMPCVLVQLVENCPWNRGTLEKYTEGKWRTVPPEDQLKLSKHDGQVWMALLNLLLKPDCQRKYDFNSFNKTQLLKIQQPLKKISSWSRLAQTYNLDVMENLVPDKPKCGACGRTGAKRCSRCQGEWYCNRECQVKHWPKHKPACKLMAEAIQKLQEEPNISR
ncbi:zinc finger MYND domain-containing protein 10 isoform X2 [Onychostoma macrolepis]|uniref:zinc finger MYND domain-containing protein 10 isoform X2 n=1 Tax=Onychostoma macrolepis TaxID=369639 RepID=UPI00272BDBBE|nr:zinc finger MYND domain-containing protein 10 isoform X2 [Onychostoma macrolepis]